MLKKLLYAAEALMVMIYLIYRRNECMAPFSPSKRAN